MLLLLLLRMMIMRVVMTMTPSTTMLLRMKSPFLKDSDFEFSAFVLMVIIQSY